MAIKRITASADTILPARSKVVGFYLTGAAASTLKLFNGTQGTGTQIAFLNILAGTTSPLIELDPSELLENGLSATITGAAAEAYVQYE
jgi:hypothetical protein